MAASCFIDLNSATGDYSVRVDGSDWLVGAPVRFHSAGEWLSSADGTLTLQGSRSESGSDNNGRFNSTVLSWQGGGSQFETIFYQYSSACLFEQHYPDGVANASVGEGPTLLSSAFPSFQLSGSGAQAGGTRGYYLWQGSAVPGYPPTGPTGTWPPASIPPTQCNAIYEPLDCSLAGVLAVFDEAMANTIVVSPASEYLAATQQFGQKTLDYGVQGRAEALPKGYRLSTIVHAQRGGVNEAMQAWGATLLRRSGKPDDVYKRDRSLSVLGYTTDNGAYYYYNTVKQSCYRTRDKCVGYEETIHQLKDHLVEQRIPAQWILYDSWFYAKATTSGHAFDSQNGVTNWTDAAPDIFPSGLRAMYERTGWFVVAHNRAWAPSNVYDKRNGGQYDFLDGKDANPNANRTWALPLRQRFWDDLFENCSRWGMANYQQDWMFTQQSQRQMMTDVGLARTWTLQMDAALVRRGLHFGYGGSNLNDWLQSLEMRSTSNGRVSMDYHANSSTGLGAGDDNWLIGLSSVLVWALRLIPSKDGFWSTPLQPGHPYPESRSEPFGALHAAVATLSRGPVTPADGIGFFNRSLIMRSCMDDGTLLQPDAPALALDSQVRNLAFGRGGPSGEVWRTGSTLSGHTYHNLLVAKLKTAYTLSTATEWPAPASAAQPLVLVSNAAGTPVDAAVALGASLELDACDRADFALLHASPVMANGWALVGELEKFVPVSAARVASVTVGGDGMDVLVRGVPAESVRLSFAFSKSVASGGRLEAGSSIPLQTLTCVVGERGTARASVSASGSSGCVAV